MALDSRSLEKRPLEGARLNRFLIVRFSAIGDCVMSVPVATSVRRAMPDVELTWAVEPRCADVIDSGRLIDRTLLIDRSRWRSRRWSPSAWREQVLTYARLREERFDFGIDLQGHSKTALCLRLAKPSKRIAAKATDALVRRLNPVVQGDQGLTHTVDWNLRTLRELGDFSTEARWIMPPLIAERAALATEGKQVASIAVGTGHVDKSYPRHKWREVAERFLEAGWRVVFLGGAGEVAPEVEGAVNYVGKLSLAQTMAVVAQSDVHLAGDTGSGHIAAAYAVPLVSIFGPTEPAVYAPYTKTRVVLRKASKVTGEVSSEDVFNAALSLRTKNEAAFSY